MTVGNRRSQPLPGVPTEYESESHKRKVSRAGRADGSTDKKPGSSQPNCENRAFYHMCDVLFFIHR